AGAMIPAYQSSVRKANEAAAVSTMNAIKVAEAKYVIDHRGQYGTFPKLSREGYLDKRFVSESRHIKGYIFVLTLVNKPEKDAVSFQLQANPESAEGISATGKIYY